MKKQIIIACLFTIINLQAKVQPVHPGENLWQIIARIGQTVDAIEACCTNGNGAPETKSCPTCDVEIEQSDVPFTITAPGVYCLAEDLSHNPNSDDPVVTINSECVTLNLCGHAIEGGFQGVLINGNSIGSGPAKVTVKNGTIKGATNDPGLVVANTTGPVKLSNLMVTGCEFGIAILNSTGVTVDHCVCSENTDQGFSVFEGGRQCVFRDCIARKNGSEGFRVEGADDEAGDEDCCFINCKGFANDGNFTVRDASHNIFIDCVATGAVNNNGFLVEGADGEEEKTRDNVFFHCTATNNKLDGFQVFDATYNVIRDCVANKNGGIGINIYGNAEFNHVIGCSCVKNDDVGIHDDPLGSLRGSLILNNIAHDNNSSGDDYSGITDATIEKLSEVGGDTGYWANVGKKS